MIDAFGVMVGLILFVAALIFTLMDWAAREYNDYSFENKKFEWEIQFAQQEGDEREQRRNVFLRDQFKAEYRSNTLLFCIIMVILIAVLFGIIYQMGNTLPQLSQIQQSNDKPQSPENLSFAYPNNTYVVNNYYNNYPVEQIIVKNENNPFSVEELKYLMQPGNGINQSFRALKKSGR
jgi:predicted PurR-regulated permease PerM